MRTQLKGLAAAGCLLCLAALVAADVYADSPPGPREVENWRKSTCAPGEQEVVCRWIARECEPYQNDPAYYIAARLKYETRYCKSVRASPSCNLGEGKVVMDPNPGRHALDVLERYRQTRQLVFLRDGPRDADRTAYWIKYPRREDGMRKGRSYCAEDAGVKREMFWAAQLDRAERACRQKAEAAVPKPKLEACAPGDEPVQCGLILDGDCGYEENNQYYSIDWQRRSYCRMTSDHFQERRRMDAEREKVYEGCLAADKAKLTPPTGPVSQLPHRDVLALSAGVLALAGLGIMLLWKLRRSA